MGHYEGRCPLGEPRQASPCGGHQHQWGADASPTWRCQGQRGTPCDVPLSSMALMSLWDVRALRPRLCEIRKSHWWRLSRPDYCSVLRCLLTVVAEVIRLVNPSCGFFPAPTKQRFRMTYASACQDQTYAYPGGRLACPLWACPRLLLLPALSRACHPIFPQRVCPRPVSRFQFFS